MLDNPIDRNGKPDPMAKPETLRLLVPIDATERSSWAVRYVRWKHDSDARVEALLLHVIEPLIRPWDILRFRAEQDVIAMRVLHAQWLLQDASSLLQTANVPYQLHHREGDVVFEILDAAEQLNCDQIVVPSPSTGLARLLSRGIVRRLMRRQRSIPVVEVTRNGLPDSG